MKSRDEIVIIMLQWMRLYTLGSRGLGELKTFLEIRLISSRIDQKRRGRIHGFLKGKLAQKSWAIEAVVGAVSLVDDIASGLALNKPRFRFKKSPDRAAIGPRSFVDRAIDSQS